MGLLSSEPQYDCDAWEKYQHHRGVFNKLELALRFGYLAGPSGVPVPKDDYYVVRPIYNLSGMGVGAERKFLQAGNHNNAPPGYFWCEYFHGPVTTVDYEWQLIDGHKILKPIFAAQGIRTGSDLSRFSAWKKITPPYFKLPKFLSTLTDVPRFNIEFIEGNIIEIHLRGGVDFPDGATQLIPIWEDMTEKDTAFFLKRGWEIQINFDSADGWLNTPRLGFLYK